MKYNSILKTLTTSFALLSISSCVFLETASSKTVMTIGLGRDLPENYQGIIIVENTPELKRIFRQKSNYFFWGIRSNDINANSLPRELKIKYATININPDIYHKSLSAEQERLENNYAQSLPPSAWRTYTINPQQVMEKAKREVPARHPDNIKNYPIGKNGTIIKLTLYIDGNGNITQKIDHIIDIGWVHT